MKEHIFAFEARRRHSMYFHLHENGDANKLALSYWTLLTKRMRKKSNETHFLSSFFFLLLVSIASVRLPHVSLAAAAKNKNVQFNMSV